MRPYQQAHLLISAAITTVVLAVLVLTGHPVLAGWSWLAGSGFYGLREVYQALSRPDNPLWTGKVPINYKQHVSDWLYAHYGATAVVVIYFLVLVIS